MKINKKIINYLYKAGLLLGCFIMPFTLTSCFDTFDDIPDMPSHDTPDYGGGEDIGGGDIGGGDIGGGDIGGGDYYPSTSETVTPPITDDVIENIDKAIRVSIKTEIYEYNVETKEIGAKIEDGKITCKGRYKFVFELDFDPQSLSRLGNKALSVDLNVVMGDYENEDNKKHIFSYNVDGGPLSWSFRGDELGYLTHFKISKDTLSINSNEENKSFFIIGIDELDEKDALNIQPVKFSISSQKLITFDQGESSSYVVNLDPKKASFDWSGKNIINRIGQEFKRNTRQITIPKYAPKIKIDLYKDETKDTLLGSFTFEDKDHLDDFKKGTLYVVLSDLLREAIGDSAYDDYIFDHDTVTLYVEYSIPETRNFFSSSFTKIENLEL